jgi:ACT domain-containing protein
MESTSNVQITISLQDPSLDDDELQAEVENLLPQMKEVDGVENVDLVPVTIARLSYGM